MRSSLSLLEPLLKEKNAFATLTDSILQLDRSSDISREAYTLLLRQCASCKSIWHGKKVHSHIVSSGKECDTLLGNLIAQMYTRCGCMDEARAAFDRIGRPNIFSWNIMLAGYAENGDSLQARRLFDIAPEWNSSSFSIVIALCAKGMPIDEAEELFERVPERDVIAWNALLTAYAQTGFLLTARKMFDRMPERSQYSWALLIRELAVGGQPDSAAELLRFMPVVSISLHHYILTGFSTSSSSVAGASAFFQSLRDPDMVSCNVMITIYASKGHLDQAKRLFDQMRQRDVVSWNSVVSMSIKNGAIDLAGSAFNRMPQQNIITVSSLLYAYTQHGHIESATKIFNSMPQRNLFPWNTLLSAYVRGGSITGAIYFFGRMPGWDVVSWSTLISAYAKNGHPQQAREVFDKMPARSIMSWNAVISGYSLASLLTEAVPFFNRMPMRDPVSWTAMISGYAQCGDSSEALWYFGLMDQEGMRPDESTYVSALDACASLADIRRGVLIHEEIILDSESHKATVAGSLVNMYSKCGYLVHARSVFDTMEDRTAPSWNTMIAGYAQNGLLDESLELFRGMEQHGTVPTFITYIVILGACSHLGDFELGAHHFVSMQEDYGIQPSREHLMCIVDLLSRVGMVEVAQEFIHQIPVELHRSDSSALLTLLTGCRSQGIVQEAEQVAEHLFRMDDQGSAAYVLLSNIHAESCLITSG